MKKRRCPVCRLRKVEEFDMFICYRCMELDNAFKYLKELPFAQVFDILARLFARKWEKVG